MKTLKFKDFKAKQILEGTKTATMRLFDDKNLSVNDELELVNSDDGRVFAKAVIIKILNKKIAEVDDVDLDGHEKWNNKEEMLKSLKSHYGNKVNLDTEVKIVMFKLIDRD